MIDAYIEHLSKQVKPRVELAWTSNPVEDYDKDFPVVMAYYDGFSAQRSIGDNRNVQNVEHRATALLGCKIEELLNRQTELINASAGWVFSDLDAQNNGPRYDAMQAVGGEVIGIRGGYVWMKLDFSAAERIKQPY